jgi:hypothetical protein
MAGFVAGGGLGDIAIRYGYHRYQTDIMLGYGCSACCYRAGIAGGGHEAGKNW